MAGGAFKPGFNPHMPGKQDSGLSWAEVADFLNLIIPIRFSTSGLGHRLGAKMLGASMWLFLMIRARSDLPVLLGMRHPWEH
ncbi:hypothetical protein JCM5353_002580 [Sporobolomyces roseus]